MKTQPIFDKTRIMDELHDIQLKVDSVGYKGSNEHDLHVREDIYNYIEKITLEKMIEHEDVIYEIFSRPYEKLKPLEKLYIEAHPHPDGMAYIPDMTTFCKWITDEFLKMKG